MHVFFCEMLLLPRLTARGLEYVQSGHFVVLFRCMYLCAYTHVQHYIPTYILRYSETWLVCTLRGTQNQYLLSQVLTYYRIWFMFMRYARRQNGKYSETALIQPHWTKKFGQIGDVSGILRSISIWVTFGTKQHGRFKQCGRFTEAEIREVSLYILSSMY